MANARSVGLTIIGVIAVFIVIGGGGYYVYEGQNYVATDNASVQGTLVPLVVPSDGTLVTWTANIGSTVNHGTVLGQIDGLTGYTNFNSPISGTIVQNNAVKNEVVVPGETVGYITNLNSVQIIAYIDETSINNVVVGKPVDITIDAYPNTAFSGIVTQIGSSSAVVMGGLENTSISGNFNKQIQRIPVYISFQGTEGKALLPGLSANVSIHRN